MVRFHGEKRTRQPLQKPVRSAAEEPVRDDLLGVVTPRFPLYGNVHIPFGPAASSAFRFQLEQRIESSNHSTAAAFSHIF